MNLLVIIVYDRLHNLQHWFDCWQKCNQDAHMVVIHTGPVVTQVPDGITYIQRPNIGFDIGALQDVCRERLEGFPNNWDKMLWCCDDLFMMHTDFASPYFDKLKGDIGCVATEISPYKRRHIRTTGFAITKAVANQLQFPADPVTTKHECYLFEHLGKGTNMLDQINTMGLKTVWAAPQAQSPLFDTGYTRRIKQRWQDHVRLFGDVKLPPEPEQPKPTVAIICPIYQNYPQIVSSLLCQTYQNWELHLVHDGPGMIDLPDDPRIKFTQTAERVGNYGHAIRAEWLHKVNSELVMINNPDNYLMPRFLEKAVSALNKNPKAVAAYCAQIVHNYTDYKVMDCSLRRGFIDCGQVLLRTKQAQEVGWNSMDHSSDWFFFNDIANKYGRYKFITFSGCHFIHN